MVGKWGFMGIAFLVSTILGCKSTKPNLKPPTQAEVLNTPPQEKRFNVAEMPPQVFNQPQDPYKQLNSGKIMPAGGAGGMGGMGSGGMGGMGMSGS